MLHGFSKGADNDFGSENNYLAESLQNLYHNNYTMGTLFPQLIPLNSHYAVNL